MKRSKRVISFLLSILMVVSVLPMNVFAEDTTNQYTLNSYGQRQYFAGDAMNIAPELDGTVGSGEYSISRNYDITGKSLGETYWQDEVTEMDKYYVSHNDATENVGVYISYDDEYIYLAATSKVKEGVTRNKETAEFAISVTEDTDKVIDIIVTQSGGVRNVYEQTTNGAPDITSVACSSFIGGSAAVLDDTTNILTYELKLSRKGLADYYETEVSNKFLCRIQMSTTSSVEGTETAGAFYWMATNESSTSTVGNYKTYLGRLGHAIFLGKKIDFKDFLGESYMECESHNYSHYIVQDEETCKQICSLCGVTTEPEAHELTEEITTREPGQVVDGEKTGVCTKCSYKATQVIPATGASNPDNYGSNTYTIMGNNILQSFIKENNYNYDAPFAILPTERMEGLMTAYAYYNPDIITFQECDEGWHDLLDADDGLTTLGYAVATDGFTTEELRMIRNVIYYKTDVFEIVDAGYESYGSFTHGTIANPWCFTWAVLASKESNERFVVSSTHVPAGDDYATTRNNCAEEQIAKLTEVSAKYNAPIVFMGDFNEVETGLSYQTLAENFADARKSAETVLNSKYGTTNSVGTAPLLVTDGGKQIDHCFYSSGIDAIKYETIVEEKAYAYSDHVPQRLYFMVNGGTTYNFENTELEELEKAGFTSSIDGNLEQTVSSQWSVTAAGLQPMTTEGYTLLNTPYTYDNFRISLDVYGGSKTGIVIGKKNTFSTSDVETSVGIVFNGDQIEMSGGIEPSTIELTKSASWNPNNAPTYIYKPSSDFSFGEGKVYTLNVELFHGVLTVWVDGIGGCLSVQVTDSFSQESIALIAGVSGVLKALNVEELGVIARPYSVDDFATYRTETGVDDEGNTYYKNAPTYKGYLFAGWFYDKACTQSVGNAVTSLDAGTTVYAKFVSQYILKLKAQVSSHLLDDNLTNDSLGKIRFITTIDSKSYSKIGFMLSYMVGNNLIERTFYSNKVYKTLYAEIGDKESGVLSYKPSEEFCRSSAYFKAWTVTGIGDVYFNVDFTATPFWKTLDGTIVKGETAIKSVNQGINHGFLKGKTALFLGDSAAYGTADEPENDYHHTGWAGRLERNYEMLSDIVAVEGATLAEYGIEKQLYTASKDDYDFVVLEGGANDVLAESTTIQADVESLIKIAKQKFPNAMVVYVISNAFGASAEKMTEYVSTIKAACDLYDITYVDLSTVSSLTNLNLTAEEYDMVTPIIADHLRYVESHSRCICGLDKNGEHFGECDGNEVLWEAWDKTTSVPSTTGNYYLTNDISLSSQQTIYGNVNLDLNGHTITSSQCRVYNTYQQNGVSLNITDLSEEKDGSIKPTATDQGTVVWISGTDCTVSLYGGTLDASNATCTNGTLGCAVNVEAGIFNVYGGTVKGNPTPGDSANGLSISVSDGATFNMSGGTITGGKSTVAGNVYMRGTMNMSGGTITGGTASESGEEGCGNVSIFGTFTMTGGTIDGNVNWTGDNEVTLGGTAVIRNNETTGKGLTIPNGKAVIIGTFEDGALIAVNGEVGVIATSAEASDLNHVCLDESAGFGEVIFDEESATLNRTNTKTRCLCGLDENGQHFGDCDGTELTWQAWIDSAKVPSTDGNYCLTVDVNVTSQQTIYGKVNLDLNGHKITSSSRVYNTFEQTDKCLNITDFSEEKNGSIMSTTTSTAGAIIYLSGTNCSVSMYAGTLDGSKATCNKSTLGCAMQMDSGVFNLYGGTVKGNSNPENSEYGLSLRVNNGATFNMSGGTITDGTSGEAGNVYMAGNMNMTGGIITGGTVTAVETGGNIFVNGTLNIYGGMIGNTTIYSATDVENESTLRLGGNAVVTYIAP